MWKREKLTPEALEERIDAKARLRAARVRAKIKAKTRLDEARDGHVPSSLAVKLVKVSTYSILIASIVIIAAGYWYDILFYMAQSDDWKAIVGLIAFAFVARTVATGAPVVLQWARPESGTPDEEKQGWGLKQAFRKHFAGDANRGARTTLRVLWVGSLIACSFATLSFFAGGHETRAAESAAIETQGSAITSNKQVRIDALEAQKGDAKGVLDITLEALERTRKTIEDETVGVSTADNQTLQDINDSVLAATATYNETISSLNAQINAIRAEEETEQSVVVERATAAPFVAAYRFLARGIGSESQWQIGGAIFFAVLFEFLCALLLVCVFTLMKILMQVAKRIELHEASEEMKARIELGRMRSKIEVDEIRLNAAQAQERAEAEIELALREREVQKAKAHAEAMREGRPWVDPDEMLEQEAALERAKNAAMARKIAAQIDALDNDEIDVDEVVIDDPPIEELNGTETPDWGDRLPVDDWR